MPNRLLHSYREGNRSEYLAAYLLSGIGTANPVLRQEDIGIDFNCALSEKEGNQLTFGYPYEVQVKSKRTSKIVFGFDDKKRSERSMKSSGFSI